jgi:hypothetical protein
LTRITSTLHEDLRTFMKTSPWILLRMRNGSNKQRESEHTFYIQYIFSENPAVYEIMWINMVRPDGQVYTIMLRRQDALQTIEYEKNADTVSSCSVLTAIQLINFIRSHKTFCGTTYKNWETTQSLNVFTFCLTKIYAWAKEHFFDLMQPL